MPEYPGRPRSEGSIEAELFHKAAEINELRSQIKDHEMLTGMATLEAERLKASNADLMSQSTTKQAELGQLYAEIEDMKRGREVIMRGHKAEVERLREDKKQSYIQGTIDGPKKLSRFQLLKSALRF